MYLATTSKDEEGCSTTTCVAVDENFFRKSLRVFDGDLTCCRIEHKGTNKCDRLSLVVPILGLYGELYRASLNVAAGGNKKDPGSTVSGVEEFLTEIEGNMDEIFPPTFRLVTRKKGRRIEEEVVLFGDLIERMRTRIKSGAGLVLEREGGTASTGKSTQDEESESNGASYQRSGSDFIRHGSDFIRHGSDFIRHGSSFGDGSARERKEGSVKVMETEMADKLVSVEKNPAVDENT